MLTRNVDELKYADIEALVRDRVPEGREIDYKQKLHGGTDKEVKEFLADVTSFANASGGHLVFGVTTKKEKGRNTNLPDEIKGVGNINSEQEQLRLEQMIRDGIDPRIIGFWVHPIVEEGKPSVVVIHIPRSWNAPHMVGKGSPKFFSRTSTGKHPLDATEIRHAFAMSESVGERIKAFRDERIGRILAGETPVPTREGAKLILHIIPMASFIQETRFGLNEIDEASKGVYPIAQGHCGRRNNLDGLLVFNYHDDKHGIGYVQLFRNGIVEAVETKDVVSTMEMSGQKVIRAFHLEEALIHSANIYRAYLARLKVAPPFVCFIGLAGVIGCELATGGGGFSQIHPIDRDIILFPDLLVKNADDPAEQFLRPAFDMLWQACGEWKSPYYTQDGKRIGQENR